MLQFTYTIKDELGIHARPAGQLVKKARTFESELELSCNGKTANLKNMLSLMSLGVKQGDEVTVTCDGPDEATALKQLQEFFQENL